jgi:HK97 family phage major capsid protein
MLNKIESKPLDSIEDPVDVKPKEQQRYSFLKAINAASRGDWSGAGFESEMSQEMAHKSGKQPQGFYVPDYAWRDDLYKSKRELTVSTDGTGGYFAPSAQLGSEWIGALRSKMVLSDLGMRVMSGLTTKIQIPKIAAATAGFVAESGDVSDNTHVTTQVTMQARTLGARTLVSRLLLLESDPSIEQIVRDDLVAAIASKIQDVAIEGGGSNEPTGITQTTGIGSIAGGTNGQSPAWNTHVPTLVKEVEQDNAALNDGTLGWLTNPKVKSKMSAVAKVSSSDSVMILNDPWNQLYGYPIRFTTDCPSDLTKGSASGVCSAMIFGDFSQLLLGSWGNSPDVLVDPYSSSNDGGVKIVVFSEVDAAVRHAQSFAACLDVLTT